MSKELKKVVEEIYGAYKDVEEETDNFQSKIDDIDTFNTLFEGIVDYTYSQTEEEKQRSMIQIMQSSFNFGEKLPDTMGGWTFETATFVLNEGIDIFEPYAEKNRLLNERMLLDSDFEKAGQIDYIIDNFDEYWNKKIQINQISRYKSEWSKFYENYQENNDPDEVADNIFEGYDKFMSDISEKLGLLDETTPQGNAAQKMSDALFNGFEKHNDFWQGYGEYIYDGIPQNIEYYKDGIDLIVNGLNKFGKNWLTGIEIIQNAITNGIVRKTKTKTNTARTTRYDPLILDLDGDGFNAEKKELGANFDLDKNGFAEKINWTSRYNLKRKRVVDMIL